MKRWKLTRAPQGLCDYQLDIPIYQEHHAAIYKCESQSTHENGREGRTQVKKKQCEICRRHIDRISKKIETARDEDVPHYMARRADVRLQLVGYMQSYSASAQFEDGSSLIDEALLALSDAKRSGYHTVLYEAYHLLGLIHRFEDRYAEAIPYFQQALFYAYNYRNQKWPYKYEDSLRWLASTWSKMPECHELAVMASEWSTLTPKPSAYRWFEHFQLLARLAKISRIEEALALGIGQSVEDAVRHTAALTAIGRREDAKESAVIASERAQSPENSKWRHDISMLDSLIEKYAAAHDSQT